MFLWKIYAKLQAIIPTRYWDIAKNIEGTIHCPPPSTARGLNAMRFMSTVILRVISVPEGSTWSLSPAPNRRHPSENPVLATKADHIGRQDRRWSSHRLEALECRASHRAEWAAGAAQTHFQISFPELIMFGAAADVKSSYTKPIHGDKVLATLD